MPKSAGRTHSTICLCLIALSTAAAIGCSSETTSPPVIKPPAPPPILVDADPDISADGLFVAYSHYDYTQPPAQLEQIWIYDRRDSTRQFVTYGRDPSWAPDGVRIAFTRGSELIVRNLQSSAESTVASINAVMPAWSPTTDAIAFFVVSGPEAGMWRTSSSGLGLRKLLPSDGAMPAWSPDGATLSIVHYDASVSPAEEIATCDTSGTSLQTITHNTYNDRFPTWSHNGQWVLWSVESPPGMGIWKCQPAGGGLQHVLTYGARAKFGPDDSYLVFQALVPGTNRVVLWQSGPSGENAHVLP